MSTTTSEHPILFGGPMIRAILDGRKIQTRRVIQPKRKPGFGLVPSATIAQHREFWDLCPYGVPGDRLIVRESWRYYDWTEDGEPQIQYQADGELRWIDLSDVPDETIEKIHNHWAELSDDENFAREGAARDKSWRPSIHMYRCFSRITLEVKRVWVERVQEISEADAKAEGASVSSLASAIETARGGPAIAQPLGNEPTPYRDSFRRLWDSINANRGHGWDTNPWVWCVEFDRVEGER